MRRTKRGGWPYGQPPNIQFEINWDSQQADGLVLWMPWGGGTPGAHRHVDRVSGLVFTEGGTPVWIADGQRGWSMLFDDALNEYLAALIDAMSLPFTLTAWARSDSLTANQAVVSLGDANGTTYHAVGFGGAQAGDPAMAWSFFGASSGATSSIAYSVNTWHHLCGVFVANDDRTIYLDGANKGTNNGNRPVTADRVAIGVSADSTPFGYLSGRGTDVRIYDRALTDTDAWQFYVEPWELYKPLVHVPLGKSPAVAAFPPVPGLVHRLRRLPHLRM